MSSKITLFKQSAVPSDLSKTQFSGNMARVALGRCCYKHLCAVWRRRCGGQLGRSQRATRTTQYHDANIKSMRTSSSKRDNPCHHHQSAVSKAYLYFSWAVSRIFTPDTNLAYGPQTSLSSLTNLHCQIVPDLTKYDTRTLVTTPSDDRSRINVQR